MFTVKVIDRKTGRPVKGANVSMRFDSFSRGSTRNEHTDYDGKVYFDYNKRYRNHFCERAK